MSPPDVPGAPARARPGSRWRERLTPRPRFGERAGPDPCLMATSLAWILLVSGTLALLWLGLARPDGAEAGPALLAGAGAFGLAAVALGGHERLPVRAFPLLLAASTALVELGRWATGVEALLLALAALALWAGWFLSPRTALVGLGWALVLHGLGLGLAAGPAGPRVTDWLATAAVLGVTGALARVLRTGLDESLARLTASSRTDATTGLLSAPALGELLDAEIERARRSGTRLSILLVRPGAEGRQGADDALRAAGATIARAIRSIDTVGRFDDEHLAVLAPYTNDSGAYILGERLASSVGARPEDASAPVSISVGVASYPRHAQDRAGVVDAMRHALAEAVALGPGRVVVYEPVRTSLAQRIEDLGLTA